MYEFCYIKLKYRRFKGIQGRVVCFSFINVYFVNLGGMFIVIILFVYYICLKL